METKVAEIRLAPRPDATAVRVPKAAQLTAAAVAAAAAAAAAAPASPLLALLLGALAALLDRRAVTGKVDPNLAALELVAVLLLGVLGVAALLEGHEAEAARPARLAALPA